MILVDNVIKWEKPGWWNNKLVAQISQIGSQKDQMKFLNKSNIRQTSIKFEYALYIIQISFFDTEIYIKDNEFHNNIFLKKTDPQISLNIFTYTESWVFKIFKIGGFRFFP